MGHLRRFRLGEAVGLLILSMGAGSGFFLGGQSEASMRIHLEPNSSPLQPVTRVLIHGDRRPAGAPQVAITFDACPARDAIYDKRIIQILRKTKTRASLFLSGKWMERFGKQTQKLSQDPLFELGVHGYSHRNLIKMTPAQVDWEIEKSLEVFRKWTGRDTVLMRTPFAVVNEQVIDAAARHQLNLIQYDVASGDPDPRFSGKKIEKNVLAKVQPGSVVVFHMNGRGHHTAEVLAHMIATLRARGYEFVWASELLE